MTDINIKVPAVDEAVEVAKSLFEKLIYPATEEVGEAIKDQFTFWRGKRKVNLLIKSHEFLKSKGLEAKHIPAKLLYPILELGSLEDDDALQIKWSSMLANAVKDPTKVKQSYPEILKQLGSMEVQILDSFYNGYVISDENNKKQMKLFMEKVSTVFQITPNETEIIADNFLRLNLFQFPSSDGGMTIGDSPVLVRNKKYLEITALGIDFIQSCKFE